jgi:hypothetical protein
MPPRIACMPCRLSHAGGAGRQPDAGTVADVVLSSAQGSTGLGLPTSTLAFFPALVGRGLLEEGGSCERLGVNFRVPTRHRRLRVSNSLIQTCGSQSSRCHVTSAGSFDCPAIATHSISHPLPNRSCIDHAMRGGGLIGKNSR